MQSELMYPGRMTGNTEVSISTADFKAPHSPNSFTAEQSVGYRLRVCRCKPEEPAWVDTEADASAVDHPKGPTADPSPAARWSRAAFPAMSILFLPSVERLLARALARDRTKDSLLCAEFALDVGRYHRRASAPSSFRR